MLGEASLADRHLLAGVLSPEFFWEVFLVEEQSRADNAGKRRLDTDTRCCCCGQYRGVKFV
jgi:hypothetical protein